MLTIKCSKCKTKLFKYKKIGEGKVLRCWRDKITRVYDTKIENKKLLCGNCRNVIGKIKVKKIEMISDSFTYSGTKV